MPSELILIALIQGIIIGILSLDAYQRSQDRKGLREAKAEAEKASKALADLHNKQVEQLKSIADKVSSHDLMIKAVTQAPNNNAMKRF